MRLVCLVSILVSAAISVGADSPQILISTKVAEQTVRELHAKMRQLDESRGAEALDAAKKQQELYFSQLRTIVDQFGVDQLNAEPRLGRDQLRDQMKQVLGPSSGASEEPPHVYRNPSSWLANESGPVLWAIVCREFAYLGYGGSRVVLDAYVVDGGVGRLTGQGGTEMSGHGLSVYELKNPAAHSISLLIQGILEWSSGHELPARAVLYRADPNGIQTMWNSGMLPGLHASVTQDQTGFLVQYHDEARHQADYADPHTTVIDTYAVDTAGLHRVSSERP